MAKVLNFKDNPLLKEKLSFVDFEKDDVAGFVASLRESLAETGGFGLAANQIGIDKAMFAIMGGMVFINPYIIESSEKQIYLEEGCLSFPNQVFKVKRPTEIKVEFYDENGTKHIAKYGGLTARVFQHEFDHVNGITFIDRAKEHKVLYNLYKRKNEKRK